MLGDAMIQPMMYFQLNNIPMFHGAYLVTKVKHSIVPNHMTTTFTGTRVKVNKTPLVDVTKLFKDILNNYNLPNSTTNQPLQTVTSIAGNRFTRGSLPPIVYTIYKNGGSNGNIETNYIKLQKFNDITGVQQDVPSERRKMLAEAVIALTEMLKAFVEFAIKNNYPNINKNYINVTSLYRSEEYQTKLYEDDKKKNDGKPSGAVAEPGTSNHSWGIAVDLRFVPQKNGDYFKTNDWSPVSKTANKEGFSFEYNPSLKWFLDNGYRFGFIIPNSLRDSNGVDEYWHFEYHGTAAICIYNELLTTHGYTAKITEKYTDFVKNPKNPDGTEAVYTDCKYITVKQGDGSAPTYGGYKNVLKTKPSENMTKNYRNAVNTVGSELNISKGIKQLMEASAYVEGFNDNNSAVYNCNNPGALNRSKNDTSCNHSNKSQRYASFTTLNEGVKSQYSRTYGLILNNKKNDVYPNGPNTKLFDFWTIYAPQSDGNDDTFYTNIVIDYLSLVFGLKEINGKPITNETTLGEFNTIN